MAHTLNAVAVSVVDSVRVKPCQRRAGRLIATAQREEPTLPIWAAEKLSLNAMLIAWSRTALIVVIGSYPVTVRVGHLGLYQEAVQESTRLLFRDRSRYYAAGNDLISLRKRTCL